MDSPWGVLGLTDVKTSKLDAMVYRQAGRDYIDINAMVEGGYWSVLGMCDYVRRRRPDVSLVEFAAILRQVDLVPRSEFATLNLSADTIERLAWKFRGYADEVAAIAGAGDGRLRAG
jgi:hypothetical protein